MKSQACEGFPDVGCPNNAEAMYDMLGWALCSRCADNWRTQPERAPQDGTIAELRGQLASLHEAIGASLALLRDRAYSAAEIVLEDAMKGGKR